MCPRRRYSLEGLIQVAIMLARDVPRAAAIAEASDQPRRPIVQRRPIGRFYRKSLLDIPPNDLGERQAAFARLGPQAARLLVGQLNLRPDHRKSVSTS